MTRFPGHTKLPLPSKSHIALNNLKRGEKGPPDGSYTSMTRFSGHAKLPLPSYHTLLLTT